MGEIFFAASGVDFSELYNSCMTFCHTYVSRVFEQNAMFRMGGSALDFLRG